MNCYDFSSELLIHSKTNPILTLAKWQSSIAQFQNFSYKKQLSEDANCDRFCKLQELAFSQFSENEILYLLSLFFEKSHAKKTIEDDCFSSLSLALCLHTWKIYEDNKEVK